MRMLRFSTLCGAGARGILVGASIAALGFGCSVRVQFLKPRLGLAPSAPGGARIVFKVQPSSSAVAGAAFARQPVLEYRDAGGDAVTPSGSISLLAYADSACTVPLSGSPVRSGAGVNDPQVMEVGFSGLNCTKAGTVYLKANAGGLASECSAAVAISAGPPTKVLFEGASIATKASCTGLRRLRTVDAFDNPSAVTGGTKTFAVASSGSGQFFSDLNCTTPVSSVDVADGTDAGTFYFKDSVLESPLLTASASGWTGASVSAAVRDPAATAVFGQANFTSVINNRNSFGYGLSVHSSGTRLYFLEADRRGRILIWNSTPTTDYRPADLALGTNQPDIYWAPSNLGSETFGDGRGIHTDGGHLYVADAGANRVLIWNSIPNANGALPDVVLGQPHFAASNGGAGSQGLAYPSGVFSTGGKLILVDRGNHRVLIWNSIPSTNQQAADVVLGQVDFNANLANEGGAVSARGLKSPESAWVQGTKLFVVDTGNHRVLVWNTVPTTNHAAADFAIGQPDLLSAIPNSGPQGLRDPHAVHSDGVRLFLSDRGNNRVLVFGAIPTAAGAAADHVLGQPDFGGTGQGVAADRLTQPSGVTTDASGRLIVVDGTRVLVWDSVNVSDGEPADHVIGQEGFNQSVSNSPGLPAPTKLRLAQFDGASGGCTDGTRFYLADTGRRRVLVWNSLPTANNAAPDFVLGQGDFVTDANVDRALGGMAEPMGIGCEPGLLAIVDVQNNRVLVYKQPITANLQIADVVLGQPDLTTDGEATTASTLRKPAAVAVKGGRILVADRGNHRVLVWNSVPTTNGAAADTVLGQPDFTTAVPNQDGGGSLHSMNSPNHVAYDGAHVVVSDFVNARTLVWDHLPTTNQEAATLSTDACPGIAAYSDGTTLYASSYSYNGGILGYRICVWDRFPTVPNQGVDRVIGQVDTDPFARVGGLGAAIPSGYVSFAGSGSKLFVVDSGFHRMVYYPNAP